jgi:hypothetical protein
VQEAAGGYEEEYGFAVLPDQYFLVESDGRAVPLGETLWKGSAEQVLNAINDVISSSVRFLLFFPCFCCFSSSSQVLTLLCCAESGARQPAASPFRNHSYRTCHSQPATRSRECS